MESRDLLIADPESGAAYYKDEELVRLCRRMSLMHFEYILNPCSMVTRRLDSDLKNYYQHRNPKCKQRVWLLVFVVLVVGLPTLYTKTMMANPCKLHEVSIDPQGDGKADAQASTMQQTDCDVQDSLTKYSIRLGFILIGAAFGLTVFMSLLTSCLQCCHEKITCCNLLEVKRQLWRPLLMFWYFYLDPRMPSLKYNNEGNIIPCLYTPVSVLMCFVYVVLMIEMGVLGFMGGRPAVGLVIAYTLGEICLLSANYVMGGAYDVIMITDSHIDSWSPEGEGKGKRKSVLGKIVSLTAARKSTCSLTGDDLRMLGALAESDNAKKFKAATDRQHGEDTVDSVGVLELFYLVDTKQVVNVVTAEVQTLHDGSIFDEGLAGLLASKHQTF